MHISYVNIAWKSKLRLPLLKGLLIFLSGRTANEKIAKTRESEEIYI